jgi:hypothetical protein
LLAMGNIISGHGCDAAGQLAQDAGEQVLSP